MKVRQHRRVHVNGQREAVCVVVQQHDDVRAPAADERYEDDEYCFHLTNGLHRCHVTGCSSLLYRQSQNTFDDDQ